MEEISIYGEHEDELKELMLLLVKRIEEASRKQVESGGEKLYEHLTYRIKSDESTREKLERKGIPVTEENALKSVKDVIGIRVVCLFLKDVYENVSIIREFPGITVVKEKDYIKDEKPNGYRSYHMIVRFDDPKKEFYAEIQLRTIAMDTWAALEHELKYKKDIEDPELIIQELKRCANDLSACDASMQTIRDLIRRE